MPSNFSDSLPEGWLAFELGVLRRLQFRSVIDPFAGECATPAYLKRWGARVAANDTARWAFERTRARVENNNETLTEADVEAVLEDAYLPTEELIETIGRLRRVGTVYTKDFTELTGARAVIVTA